MEDQWNRGNGLLHTPKIDVESVGGRFDGLIKDGKLRAAVRSVTECGRGCLYQPGDKCTKTGRPVLDILREKHPEARIPAEKDFDVYPNTPDSIGIFVFEEDVVKQVAFCTGTVSPSGVNADALKAWLLWYGAHWRRFPWKWQGPA